LFDWIKHAYDRGTANVLLSLAADHTGSIREDDAKQLEELGKMLREAKLLDQAGKPTSAAIAAKPEAIEKWKDMRFGMFICWGPVTLTGKEIGWSRGKPTPVEKYDNLYKEWNPTNFDAKAWAKVVKDTGAKYVVFLTKHHDGFCLFDTKQTDYNIMNGPFKRDVTKELADACRAEGIGFFPYYSTCDWHHPDFPVTSPGGNTKRQTSNLDKYTEYLEAQTGELIRNYGPLTGIWFDVPQCFDKARGERVIRHVRSLQPDLLVNNRTGAPGDFDTPEQNVGKIQFNRPWESCITLGTQWTWKPDDAIKPWTDAVRILITCAIGDGNLALNTNPMPDGRIEPRQVENFKKIGEWLKQYGESIYGTRGGPFVSPGAGAVKAHGGKFDLPGGEWWGGSTHKGNVIYLHILRWPFDRAQGRSGDVIKLPVIKEKIVKHSVLTGGEATVKQTDAGIEVSVPADKRDSVDTIVKLELAEIERDFWHKTPSLSIMTGFIYEPKKPYTIQQWMENLGDKFDADQWVKDFKETGADHVIFYDKWIDGLVFHDTKTTGFKTKRDFVREMADACHRGGLPLVLYFNAVSDGNPEFDQWALVDKKGKPVTFIPIWPTRYQTLHSPFRRKSLEQVRELLSNYGTIHGIWYDVFEERLDTASPWTASGYQKMFGEPFTEATGARRAEFNARTLAGYLDEADAIRREQRQEHCLFTANGSGPDYHGGGIWTEQVGTRLDYLFMEGHSFQNNEKLGHLAWSLPKPYDINLLLNKSWFVPLTGPAPGACYSDAQAIAASAIAICQGSGVTLALTPGHDGVFGEDLQRAKTIGAWFRKVKPWVTGARPIAGVSPVEQPHVVSAGLAKRFSLIFTQVGNARVLHVIDANVPATDYQPVAVEISIVAGQLDGHKQATLAGESEILKLSEKDGRFNIVVQPNPVATIIFKNEK
jgi:alpha-L-fucosidase